MNWTIIYYFNTRPTHLESLKISNPQAQIIPIATNNDKNHRNTDRALRKCLQNIRDIIYYDNILLVQNNVYINMEIPRIDFQCMFGKHIIHDKNNGWLHWSDIQKIPEKYVKHATGISPWAFIGIKSEYLRILLDPTYDQIYEMDIFKEIRSSTLVQAAGGEISQCPEELTKYILNNTKENEQNIRTLLSNNTNLRGAFHPVPYTTLQ